jgi:urate oxidase / 2-oxo-4-hydroxy-4-carboxy-5-ureidoimidazoline decarboxylase
LQHFSSGRKRNYYGKGDVVVYRLNRDGNTPLGCSPVFGANVLMLLYGDAFWPTYATGDNTNLVATDSMKNFIQRETLNFPGYDLEAFCFFLAEKFMKTYPHTEGIQVSASEIPYAGLGAAGVAFRPTGFDRNVACIELHREGEILRCLDARSGIAGFKLLRLGGSAFTGFLRDEYTTLPDIQNRPLHMWLDLEWVYHTDKDAFTQGEATKHVRRIVHEVFQTFESGSIQQVIFKMGNQILAEIKSISEVRLEAENRTWDTIVEQGDRLGVFTDPRPPFGCLGLTLRREN